MKSIEPADHKRVPRRYQIYHYIVGTILLSTHGNIAGPGGQTVMHDTDGDLLVYHYYDANNNGTATLGLNLPGWDSAGWPYVR